MEDHYYSLLFHIFKLNLIAMCPCSQNFFNLITFLDIVLVFLLQMRPTSSMIRMIKYKHFLSFQLKMKLILFSSHGNSCFSIQKKNHYILLTTNRNAALIKSFQLHLFSTYPHETVGVKKGEEWLFRICHRYKCYKKKWRHLFFNSFIAKT